MLRWGASVWPLSASLLLRRLGRPGRGAQPVQWLRWDASGSPTVPVSRPPARQGRWSARRGAWVCSKAMERVPAQVPAPVVMVLRVVQGVRQVSPQVPAQIGVRESRPRQVARRDRAPARGACPAPAAGLAEDRADHPGQVPAAARDRGLVRGRAGRPAWVPGLWADQREQVLGQGCRLGLVPGRGRQAGPLVPGRGLALAEAVGHRRVWVPDPAVVLDRSPVAGAAGRRAWGRDRSVRAPGRECRRGLVPGLDRPAGQRVPDRAWVPAEGRAQVPAWARGRVVVWVARPRRRGRVRRQGRGRPGPGWARRTRHRQVRADRPVA